MEELKATHEELCDSALAHYERIAEQASEWNSLVPKAIEFYRVYGKIMFEKEPRRHVSSGVRCPGEPPDFEEQLQQIFLEAAKRKIKEGGGCMALVDKNGVYWLMTKATAQEILKKEQNSDE